MIVDDSTEMRGLIRDLVSPWADAVVECADGAECLERHAACNPDWTVMDVRMPRLDGLSTVRALQAVRPAARVLLVTQFPSAALERAASEAGAVGCLAKENLHRVVEVLNGGALAPLPCA